MKVKKMVGLVVGISMMTFGSAILVYYLTILPYFNALLIQSAVGVAAGAVAMMIFRDDAERGVAA